VKHITVITKEGSYIGMWPLGTIEIQATQYADQVSFGLAGGQIINYGQIKSIKVDTY